MANKQLFRAIIIDDDPNRNSTYEEVLSQRYELKIINDITQLTRRMIMQYDLMVIDICLSKDVASLTAFKIIDDYNLTLPTVLVSSEWLDQDGQPNEFILCVPRYKNIIKVIGWNDFNKGNNNAIACEIYYEFCRHKNYLQENTSEKCVVLHISDLQFGGKISGLACNDNDRIADYLAEKNIIPDLLIITGDIADKGKKREFDEAKAWIEHLAAKIWKLPSDSLTQQERERIILVPGNHDYNLAINASELFEFKFGQSQIDSFTPIKNVEVYENQKLGFYNFIEFAKSLTGDDDWNNYLEQPLHVISKYINMGIQIFTLNSVFTISNRNCENRFDNFYCDLATLDESKFKCNDYVNGSICNILVMHNAPENFKRETNNGLVTWNRLQTLIEGYKIKATLYGHTHDFHEAHRLRDNGGKYCKNLLCISAPCVRLNAASRTEDANRGFNIIEFNKQDGIVKEIVPRYFELKKASIQETTDSPAESFAIKNLS